MFAALVSVGMEVVFTKTNHERHELALVRDDGTREVASDLETRSYLRHDFMHYVVEKEAGLKHSFYGSVVAGKTFADMRMDAHAQNRESPNRLVGEGGLTELIVASLQGAQKEGFSVDELLTQLPGYLKVQGFDTPAYLTRDFVERATKAFAYLLKRYDGLKTGEALTLTF